MSRNRFKESDLTFEELAKLYLKYAEVFKTVSSAEGCPSLGALTPIMGDLQTAKMDAYTELVAFRERYAEEHYNGHLPSKGLISMYTEMYASWDTKRCEKYLTLVTRYANSEKYDAITRIRKMNKLID